MYVTNGSKFELSLEAQIGTTPAGIQDFSGRANLKRSFTACRLARKHGVASDLARP